MKYKTIVCDPPWPLPMSGERQRGKDRIHHPLLPYVTMSMDEIEKLPVYDLAEDGCHLWLWTTNRFIAEGYQLIKEWGFTYLAPIHWIKPSGIGNYVIHRTQTILLAYKNKCQFTQLRYFPNIIHANPGKHSEKPQESYDLIIKVSQPKRLDMFARESRIGWDVYGDEVANSIEINHARSV